LLDVHIRGGNEVNKAQLIEALAGSFHGSKREAAEALESVLETIKWQVAKGEKVGITGFGTFEKIDRPARMVRNPRTNEKTRKKKSSVAKFRMGAGLKAAVNGLRKPPAAKKAVAAASKSTSAKKTATKATSTMSAATKSAPASSASKTTAAKSAPAKKTATKATTAKKTPAAKKSTAATATVAKKTPAAKKSATKSAPAKKTTCAAKTGASKTTSRKSPAKRAAKKS
jgi:DNA-binding protein HU-beta